MFAETVTRKGASTSKWKLMPATVPIVLLIVALAGLLTFSYNPVTTTLVIIALTSLAVFFYQVFTVKNHSLM